MSKIQSKKIIEIFNKQLGDLLDEVCNLFPDYKELRKAQSGLNLLKKATPTVTIKLWKQHVSSKYNTEIMEGDVNFFLTKDYKNDVEQIGQSDQILGLVDKLRKPMQEMGEDNQKKTMKYIQNLTKLSLMI